MSALMRSAIKLSNYTLEQTNIDTRHESIYGLMTGMAFLFIIVIILYNHRIQQQQEQEPQINHNIDFILGRNRAANYP